LICHGAVRGAVAGQAVSGLTKKLACQHSPTLFLTMTPFGATSSAWRYSNPDEFRKPAPDEFSVF
jgi:hypothetical protein